MLEVQPAGRGSTAAATAAAAAHRWVGDAQLDTLELDRAHRSLGSKPPHGSRPFIVRFHKYAQKECVLLWAKETRDVSYQGHPIRIFEDFSAALAKKRATFNKVKSRKE
ncbi:hypothetical protein CRUP_037282 [Coryphaenoides rupestris]|nr:hypothetical protein CRUP_037282 [Coryphaenoides rupestris]